MVAEPGEQTIGFYPPLSEKVTEREKSSLVIWVGKGKGKYFFYGVKFGKGRWVVYLKWSKGVGLLQKSKDE